MSPNQWPPWTPEPGKVLREMTRVRSPRVCTANVKQEEGKGKLERLKAMLRTGDVREIVLPANEKPDMANIDLRT